MVTDKALKYGHLIAAVIHGSLAIAGFILTSTIFEDKGFVNLTNNTGLGRPSSEPKEIIIEEEEEDNIIATYQLPYLVSVFPLLSMINHVYSYTMWDEYNNTILKQEYNPVRWGEYSISAGVMLWIIGQLSSISDVGTLIPLTLANVPLQGLGYLGEKQIGEADTVLTPEQETNVYATQMIGFSVFALSWITIFINFFTVIAKSESDVPDSIYIIIIAMFILFLMFGVLSVMNMRRKIAGTEKLKTSSYRNTEMGYIILSLVSKTLLFTLTFSGGIFV